MHPDELLIVGLAVAISLGAIAVSLLASDFARRASGVVVLVAGAVLVGVTVFHLAPEAARMGVAGAWALAAGVAVGGGLELAGRWLTRGQETSDGRNVARMALAALALHSTIDGGVYAVTFSHDQVSGLLVGLGLVLHEAPEGAIALVLALQGGWVRWKAIAVAVLASSVTTPLGWIAGSMAGAAAHGEIELLFAGSAGLLAYTGVRLVANGLRRERAGNDGPASKSN